MTEFVEFSASDGTQLRGELRQAGTDWAVLVHEFGRDLDGWRPLAADLRRREISVLAFDLRGHGGSDGEPDRATIADDVAAALGFATASGAGRMFAAGAGVSVPPAIGVAEREKCHAFIAIGAAAHKDAPVRIPRLVILASRDAEQTKAAAELQRGSGWAVVVNVPSDEQGLDLLAGRWSMNVRSYVVGFLRERRTTPEAKPRLRGIDKARRR